MDDIMVNRINVQSAIALCALLAAGCTPAIEEGQFQCNPDELCPENFHCFDGFCCTTLEACELLELDAGPDGTPDVPGVDASMDVPAADDAFVEPDVPDCMSIAGTLQTSRSANGVVTVQLSGLEFDGLTGEALVRAEGINVQSATFDSGIFTLAYRAPRSVSVLARDGGNPLVFVTITQGTACFQANLALPVTLGLQVIAENDESACSERCAEQSVDVASEGTVAFTSADPFATGDLTPQSDVFIRKVGGELVPLSQSYSEPSRYLRIADDGTTVVYSPGSGRLVSQLTSTPYTTDERQRNCVITGANWCNPAFEPTEVITSPATRVGFLEMNTPRTGVDNIADLFRRTGVPEGQQRRGAEFVDIRVNGNVFGFAQVGHSYRAVDGETPVLLDFGEDTDQGYFPGIEERDAVFQRGTSVVVVRDGLAVHDFNNSRFLGASANLDRVLVVHEESLFLLEWVGDDYDDFPIQTQSTTNVLTNLALANVERPAALSGNGRWIGALLGSPARVVRIVVE